MTEIKTRRQEQKKTSRDKNNMTTMAISRSLMGRLVSIQEQNGFDKRDEALDEVISEYENNHPEITINQKG